VQLWLGQIIEMHVWMQIETRGIINEPNLKILNWKKQIINQRLESERNLNKILQKCDFQQN